MSSAWLTILDLYLLLQAAGSHANDEAINLVQASRSRKQLGGCSDAQNALQAVTADSSADNSANDATAAQQLSVCDAFAGRTVFLTGATGFVGSLVLEQLLRTCPDIHKVFVLVRQKRGVPPQQRIHQLLFASPLFRLLGRAVSSDDGQQVKLISCISKQMQSDEKVEFQALATKVEAIPGDLTLPGFGIADADVQKLQAETEIVVHAAASISFDDHIHDAIMHNYIVSVCMSCHNSQDALQYIAFTALHEL